ncbi:hypothetical protein BSL78_25065 [Apostichopus japonicus]|uniref:Uncharacterized protein n=1 Tax=Stichopus japonicus TaxID=307972 RepID=A0A2G8JQW4_STIJA|nr:hypothetical protein BSL78_25065 [Apostichopus japonicus]
MVGCRRWEDDGPYVFWFPYRRNERHYVLDLQTSRWLLNEDPESFFPLLPSVCFNTKRKQFAEGVQIHIPVALRECGVIGLRSLFPGVNFRNHTYAPTSRDFLHIPTAHSPPSLLLKFPVPGIRDRSGL